MRPASPLSLRDGDIQNIISEVMRSASYLLLSIPVISNLEATLGEVL